MKKTDNNHKLYVNDDGVEVPRVSSIIKILAKDALIVWANMLGFKHVSYKSEIEKAAKIGTLVHHVLEIFNKNGIGYIDNDIFRKFGMDYSNIFEKKSTINALKSFFDWYDNHRDMYKPISYETTIVGSKYGGTIDVILQGIHDKNKVIIGDYKTSSSVYMSMYLQLAAYVQLYEEKYGENSVEGVAIFSLDKKNGSPAIMNYMTRDELEVYISAFNSLLVTAEATSILNACYKDQIIQIF